MSYSVDGDIEAEATPEPGTFVGVGTALLAIAAAGFWRRRTNGAVLGSCVNT